MASIETTTLIEANPAAVPSSAESIQLKGWKATAIAADIATLGAGTLLAGLFNVALVFVVPKLLTVEDYGYWRMFGLYAGYVGFLHFGFADGALLRWAGRPLTDFHEEFVPSLKYLFLQHLALLVPLCAVAWFVFSGPLWFVALAVAIYAPLYNITATLQFGLQGARFFRPVAISTVAAPALFCLFILAWGTRWTSSFREVVSLFLLGWCVPLAFLLVWLTPWSGRQQGTSAKELAKHCLLAGWPIVVANTCVNLIQYADRLAISWVADIQNFAQYSLAASAMAVPITAIQACSKVLFSHLAGVTPEGRRRVYGISSRILLITWAALLPCYFALHLLVRHLLPKYIPSLQYARILLLGIPFLAGIQILQMSYAYLNGMQWRFLRRTAIVLAISLGATCLAAFSAGSLALVAGVQVVVLGAWWLFNEWNFREWTGQRSRDWGKFVAVYFLTGASYWFASGREMRPLEAVGLYYVAAALILSLCCREEMRVLRREVRGRQGTVPALP